MLSPRLAHSLLHLEGLSHCQRHSWQHLRYRLKAMQAWADSTPPCTQRGKLLALSVLRPRQSRCFSKGLALFGG